MFNPGTHSTGNEWLHGERRNGFKMGGDVLVSAAWQAVCGDGTEPSKEASAESHTVAVLDIRSDLLALFIRAVSA